MIAFACARLVASLIVLAGVVFVILWVATLNAPPLT